MMNVQSRLPTTADEFLAWNEGRQGKREFVKGRVVEMMINVTERHYRLASRLLVQLAEQLDPIEYIVGSADFGARTAEGIRYPDVMVHRASDPKSLATDSPLLIAEVLSPSSMSDDFGPKVQDYLGIASLQHYIVLSQDDICLWLWTRRSDGWEGPGLLRGEAVVLAGLGISLDLARLYAGIVD